AAGSGRGHPIEEQPERCTMTRVLFLTSLWLLGSLLGTGTALAAPIAITNGTVYTAEEGSEPLDGATVLIDGDRIVAVGVDVDIPTDATIVDAAGGVVTPGFIDVGTALGLVEIWAVGTTRDSAPADVVRAAFETRDAYNPEATAIEVSRIEGITSAVALPSGGLVAGQAFHCLLDGERVVDTCSDAPAFMVIALGEHGASAVGGSRGEAGLRLRELLGDARLYG